MAKVVHALVLELRHSENHFSAKLSDNTKVPKNGGQVSINVSSSFWKSMRLILQSPKLCYIAGLNIEQNLGADYSARLILVRLQRKGGFKRKQKTEIETESTGFLIVDSAVHSAVGLFNFITKLKSSCRHCFMARLIPCSNMERWAIFGSIIFQRMWSSANQKAEMNTLPFMNRWL